MYISIDKYQFEIRLNKPNSPIYIESRKTDVYIVSVPANLRDKELYEYLKINAKKLIKAFVKNSTENPSLTIQMYDKSYTFICKPNSSISYHDDRAIYSSVCPKSTLAIKNICKELLYFDIKTLIGAWEERLDCIIENIYLKNYKTKPFKICPQSNTIYFSTQLINRSYSYVEFMVAKGVFQYLKMGENNQQLFLEKYVDDYRQSTKIYNYERVKPL